MVIKTTLPDYLYHYTSLESLVEILKSRKLRFSSLLKVDDAEEMQTSTNSNIGKYCFVSSWTDIKEESIPFWSMYTNNMEGVRIKLHTLPFAEIHPGIFYPVELLESSEFFSYIPMPFCRRVIYTEDKDLLYLKDITKATHVGEDNYIDIEGNFIEVGLYKRKCWEFQSEWRYNMFFIPHDVDGKIQLDISKDNINIKFSIYDLPIEEEYFNEIEIMTGPRMNIKEKEKLKVIAGSYCKNIKIISSELKIK